MKPKTSFWIALLALFALVAAACGDGGGDGDGDASEAAGGGGGEGEITLMHGITGAAEQEALQAAVDAYQEESGQHGQRRAFAGLLDDHRDPCHRWQRA